jgi:site-specific recombinase XerD
MWNSTFTNTRCSYTPEFPRKEADALSRFIRHTAGRPLTRQKVQYRVKRAALKARADVGVHVLRHTFCSHLAMRGAPARAIQELAGHSELGVTQRYMHLSPAALDAAIRLLDGPGNIVATAANGG